MLHQSWLMPQCIVRWFFHWCAWQIQHQTHDLLLTTWASSWRIWDMLTWLQSMQWGTLRVHLSMGLSMIWIKRLTCMLMLIRIGRSTEKKSTLGCFFNLRSSMGYWFGRMQSCMALSTTEARYVATFLAICEVVCLFRKLLFDLIGLTWIFCIMKRGVVNIQYVIPIEIPQKREWWILA